MKKFKKISIVILAVIFVLGLVGTVKALAPATSPDLGTADSFSILAKTLVSSIPTSSISGDVGLDNAGSNIAGLTSVEVTGTIYDTNGTGPDAGLGNNPSLMTNARGDNNTAFLALSAVPNVDCGVTYAGSKDLATLTLAPGIYCADAFTLSGILTLDDSAGGVWIFRSAADLVTSTDSSVVFSSGLVTSACNVWWKVVSSATIGVRSHFIGNILAATSIWLNTDATLVGRALAYTGEVTLASNTISGCPAPVVSPTLNVIKHVSGGTASAGDWILTVASDGSGIGSAVGSETGTPYTLETGHQYSVTENAGPSGYTPSLSNCTIENAIAGTNYICTITNTYRRQSSGSIATARVVVPVFQPTINILSTPVVYVAPIIPLLPKTGFAPQGSGIWYESLLNNILNLFR